MSSEEMEQQSAVAKLVEFLRASLGDRKGLPTTELIGPFAVEQGLTFEGARDVLYEAIRLKLVELTTGYSLRLPAPRSEAREAASWDETFMRMALVVANRSKDPSTQVGACVVSEENRILSLGYNGTPNGWADDQFPWAKVADDPLDTKYPYVIHAERNAVLNYGGIHSQLRGSKVYVTHFPCNDCAKELAQVGISELIYLHSHDSSDFSTRASLRIFEACGIAVRQLELD